MSQDASSKQTIPHVELGKIGRPHGVRGEVRLFLHNPASDLIFDLATLLLVHPESGIVSEHVIHSVKESSRFHILSLKDIRNREKAQGLGGLLVQVRRDQFPEPEEGEYYIADLMGMVVTCEGEPVGKIVSSREQGGIEVISVENDIREIQIPLVDDYVVKMDVDSMILEVKNIDFLPVCEISRTGR